MRLGIAAAVVGAFAIASSSVQATVTYDTWVSNASPNGNYQLTIDHNAATSSFNYNLTVSPWNAEALGLFLDFGSRDLTGSVVLTNVSPAGQVTVYATDTTSDSCGTGCNLNGLSVPLSGDNEWELVFRLGDVGFDSIQTFSWTTQDFGLSESDFGLAAIRAQQLCTSGTLPNGSCGDSDKAYGSPHTRTVTIEGTVPEPSSFTLLAAAVLVVPLMRGARRIRQ
jgi:hypothetical protein